ncbi:MAG: mannosyltransferase [Homoserinimonas sp.]|jgi:glycosyltransferase involved in cell wall biosynthesis|nr:mannosyltransferase [Homoserinimonas sp.]
MKIVFDCRYTRTERHDGISRYTACLVAALGKLHPVTMLISDERQLALLPELPWIKGSDPTSLREPWVSKVVNAAKPDVVFTPMQTMGSAGRKYRFILTIHDLIYFENRTPPHEFSWLVRAGWWVFYSWKFPMKMLLRRADAVVTGSYTTREELIAAGLDDRPITVIRSAVEQHAVKPRSRPAKHTLVYMGSFMPYKNVETVARAMHHLPGYSLELLSRVSVAERTRIESLAPSGTVVFRNGVSDDEYRQSLEGATALISASRQEGFGIPLVEAMSLGTPIVVSDIPVFHEIGGDAACFFDPDAPGDLAAAVKSLDREGEWERRSAASVQKAAEFTWEASARTLLELARSVTEAGRAGSAKT